MSGPVSGRAVAPPGRRFHAWVIDRLIALVGYAAAAAACYLLVRPGSPGAAVIAVGIAALLLWLVGVLLTGLAGITPGRSLTGLRVVDTASGEPIGLARAALRQAIVGLGGYPTLGLGDATLAWTATLDHAGERRAWHDRVAGSVVVDVRTRAVEARPVAEVVNLTALRLVPAAPAVPGASSDSGCWRVTFDTGPSLVVGRLALIGRNPEPTEPTEPTAPTALAGPTGLAGPAGDEVQVLAVADPSLSKTHAQLGLAPDGALVVMDRGSTNGSVLLRAGVTRPLRPRQPTTLLAGDRVRFGDREMTVERSRT